MAELPQRLERATRNPLQDAEKQLSNAQHRCTTASRNSLSRHTESLANMETRLKALDPARILARGWSITRNSQGRVIRLAANVELREQLTTQLADGKIVSTVTSTEPDTQPKDTTQ